MMVKSDELHALADGEGEFMVTDRDIVIVYQTCLEDGPQNIVLRKRDLLQMLAKLDSSEAAKGEEEAVLII